MKFITGLVLGVVGGYAAAQWMRSDDPSIVTGPTQGGRQQNSAVRTVSDQGRRLTGRATTAGMEAINKARANIQSRLSAPDNPDDPTWN